MIRDTVTKEITFVLRNLAKNLPDNPILTTHSFKILFKFQLWRYTIYSQFVKHVIGHEKVELKSFYIENLSSKKKQQYWSKA